MGGGEVGAPQRHEASFLPGVMIRGVTHEPGKKGPPVIPYTEFPAPSPVRACMRSSPRGRSRAAPSSGCQAPAQHAARPAARAAAHNPRRRSTAHGRAAPGRRRPRRGWRRRWRVRRWRGGGPAGSAAPVRDVCVCSCVGVYVGVCSKITKRVTMYVCVCISVVGEGAGHVPCGGHCASEQACKGHVHESASAAS